MALRRVEVLFIAVPIIAMGAILFSVLNEAVDTGVRLHGQVRGCSGGGRLSGSRQCIVATEGHELIGVESLYVRAGDVVTISKRITRLSGTTVYAIVPN